MNTHITVEVLQTNLQGQAPTFFILHQNYIGNWKPELQDGYKQIVSKSVHFYQDWFHKLATFFLHFNPSCSKWILGIKKETITAVSLDNLIIIMYIAYLLDQSSWVCRKLAVLLRVFYKMHWRKGS